MGLALWLPKIGDLKGASKGPNTDEAALLGDLNYCGSGRLHLA